MRDWDGAAFDAWLTREPDYPDLDDLYEGQYQEDDPPEVEDYAEYYGDPDPWYRKYNEQDTS